MSTTREAGAGKDALRHRIRNAALGLATVALAFYFGIIAILIYRSHH